MTNINDLLEERKKTHGDFMTVAATYDKMLNAMEGAPNWHSMSSTQRLALTMIVSKIARVLTGNPSEVDHFRDVAGYAQLVVRELEKK